MPQRAGVVPMVILVAVVCGLAAADDWPQLGGPTRDGVWREEGIVQELPEELTVVWETTVAMGYSGPAVADGKVYAMEFGPPEPGAPGGVERTRCLDAGTGELLWRKHTARQ